MTEAEARAAGFRVRRDAFGAALEPDAHAPCQRCGHLRILHSFDRGDDFACSIEGCDCHWDPFLAR